MDDADLVQRAVAGDRDAFAAIYDRYAPRIYDFLRSLLRDPDEAADAVQDTFLVAGARLHQLRDPAKLRPWLYAIARHRGLRAIKQRGRQRPLDDADMTASDPDADPAEMAADTSAENDLAALVAAAGAGLGPRDQVILDLHLRQGLEGEELGDALGVSASHAYVLVSRLRDQMERSLGALLVARQGREDCPELATVLADWDGRFTPVWRKRVARHADGCPVCSDRRSRLLTPAGLLGAAPAFALPAGIRDRVLGDLELCSHTGPPFEGGKDGFPPPVGGRRRLRPAVVAAVVVVLVLLGMGAFQVLGEDKTPPTELAAVGGATTTSSAPTSTSTSAPLTGSPAGSPTTGPGSSGAPDSTDPTPVVDPELEPVPDPSVTTTSTGPTSPPTTTMPPDTTPPMLGGLVVSPGTIRAVTPCVIGSPRSATVTVTANDASGIESVVLTVGAPVSTTLDMAAAGGSTYATDQLGPYPGNLNQPTVTVVLTVRATDAAGNVASRTGSFDLQCVSPTPQ